MTRKIGQTICGRCFLEASVCTCSQARKIAIPGYRQGKDGKLVKTKPRLDASAKRRQRTSKRVRVVRRVV